MRIVTKFSVLISLFFTASALAADSSTHEYHLNNGLKLVVKEDHRSPVVISEIWYKTGSSYEVLGKTGLAHMLEHMMFKGTPLHPGDQFLQLIAQNGGEQNAFTSTDYTGYYQMLSADKLPLSFELEADRMHNLEFKPKQFASEHQVVMEERQLRIVNNPQALLYERFLATALPASPYQNPTAGWPSDLQHMTLKDAKQWYENWYGPNNATVVVVGDVKPEEVYQLAQKYFGPLKPITLPEIKPHEAIKPLGPRKIVVKAPAKLPYLLIGFNTPSAVSDTDPPTAWEPYALEVLANILAGSNSSRLNQQLVRDKQIANDIGINYDLYSRLPDLFTIGATPAQGHTVKEVQAAIFDQIKKVQKEAISKQELERIKTQVIAQKIYAQDSIEYEADLIGSLESVGLSWQEVDNYQNQIRAITPAQVQAVAQKYLVADHATIGIVQPLPTNSDAPAASNPLQGGNNVQ